MNPIEFLLSLFKLIPKDLMPYVALASAIGYGMFLGWLKSKGEE